ncbi:MAG: hypothetical protein DME50_04375, partial [Verrucomicrobia bacterium]
LGATRAVIERGLVQINCAIKVALRCFVVGILNELIVPRWNQPITPDETERKKDRQPTQTELVDTLHRRQFAQL